MKKIILNQNLINFLLIMEHTQPPNLDINSILKSLNNNGTQNQMLK